ncbi:MAG: large repetitive protein, partial [Solirubrobacteraceae bacterium]|nr:large repetitive protein [Solirubrobacteraceae bacterium]
MTSARVRRSIAVIAAGVAALGAAPGAARAGTYDVVACDAAPRGVNNSWVGTASTPRMAVPSACPTNRDPLDGMGAMARVEVGPAATFAAATQSLDAPAGAKIVSLSTQFAMQRKSAQWQVGLFADGRMLTGCKTADVYNFCLYSTAFPGVTKTWSFAQVVRRVYAQTECGDAGGCPTGPRNLAGFPERAGVRVYAATVRVRDDSVPAIWDNGSGPLTNGGWQRGTRAVGYAVLDNVGVRATRFFVDGRQRDDLAPACDFTRRVPCPNLPSPRYVLETQALPDGPHQLRIDAVDTAGNVGGLVRTFVTDNTPPDVPDGVAVDGGESWRHVNGFRLSWANPAGVAPIAAAHYELCPVAGGPCTIGERRAEGVSAIADLRVPEPGDYTVRVWLEDAAGNVNAGSRSAPVHLRFDDVAPGMAQPLQRSGWLRSAELDEPIALGQGQLVPLSGIAGYSVTTDGSEPDATVDTHDGVYSLRAVAEGVTRLRARAISGSGAPSLYVGEALVRVDRSPPAAAIAGAPGDGWQARPVTLGLRGSDQPALSGMTPAGVGEPIQAGGFLEWQVDGADPERVRGDAADVTLDADGDHSVVLHAVDAAGNESQRRTVQVRIDRTAPELVVFERADPADPRSIAVAVADRTSGVAGGVVELRRVGTAGWRSLPTALHAGRLTARLDDRALAGTYVLRARVRDRAGNEAVGDRRRGGAPVVVDTRALRTATRLRAGVDPAGGPRRAGPPTSTTLGFGKSAAARGTVVRAGGAPVAHGLVEVWSRSAVAGSGYARVARVRTDAGGGF